MQIRHYQNIDLNYFSTAPTTLSVEKLLPCSAESLFEIFVDAQSWPIWAPAIARIEWTTAAPFGVGTQRCAYLKGNLHAHEEFIAWQKPKRMTFKFTQGNVPVLAFAEDYQVEPISEHRCKVKWTVAMTPTALSKVLMPVSKPILSWYLNRIMNNLVDYINTRKPN